MATNEIHVGDIGTAFTLTISDENGDVVNLAGATVTLNFFKPDNSYLSKSGTVVGDGSTGQVTYTTVSGDLNLHGVWKLQALVDLGATEFYSDIVKFTVFRNL